LLLQFSVTASHSRPYNGHPKPDLLTTPIQAQYLRFLVSDNLSVCYPIGWQSIIKRGGNWQRISYNKIHI